MNNDGLEKLDTDELDALVAEEVMGWRWCKSSGIGGRPDYFYLAEPAEHSQMSPEYVFTTGDLPSGADARTKRLQNTEESFSGTWSGAEKIVEKMHAGKRELVSIAWQTGMSDDFRQFDYVAEFRRSRSIGVAETLPRAICIAAIRAVRVMPSPAQEARP